jgi:hypothetical protein
MIAVEAMPMLFNDGFAGGRERQKILLAFVDRL